MRLKILRQRIPQWILMGKLIQLRLDSSVSEPIEGGIIFKYYDVCVLTVDSKCNLVCKIVRFCPFRLRTQNFYDTVVSRIGGLFSSTNDGCINHRWQDTETLKKKCEHHHFQGNQI